MCRIFYRHFLRYLPSYRKKKAFLYGSLAPGAEIFEIYFASMDVQTGLRVTYEMQPNPQISRSASSSLLR